MKRIAILLVTYIILLSGCATVKKDVRTLPSVVCTSFPAYDFARNIAGDKAEVSLLVPIGTDIHSFDPSPKDIIRIENADIFIANGGESDSWARELVANLDIRPDEILYMTELSEFIDVTDEHIWTSPKNAMVICKKISEVLCDVDKDSSEYYKNNTDTYTDKLILLDQRFCDAVAEGVRRTVVFGDRFPFFCLMTEYGLDYYAAFSGCSELTEPTAKAVSDLIERVERESVPIVFYVEFSNRKICDTICNETGAMPMLMHSVHNLTKEEFESGADYISIMTDNAKALKEALA